MKLDSQQPQNAERPHIPDLKYLWLVTLMITKVIMMENGNAKEDPHGYHSRNVLTTNYNMIFVMQLRFYQFELFCVL